MILHPLAEVFGGVLAHGAIVDTEGGGTMAVDIEFAFHFAANENGDDDFGFGFGGAGEVARVGVHVVDDDGFSGGSGSTADALIERDASVRGHRAFERAEFEHVFIFGIDHVEADPVVLQQVFVEQRDDRRHESLFGGGADGQGIELRNQVAFGFRRGF